MPKPAKRKVQSAKVRPGHAKAKPATATARAGRCTAAVAQSTARPTGEAAQRILAQAEKGGVSVGRPSEYEPAMCDAVIAHARVTGLSLSAFADEVGVDRATLTRWAQRHPEFCIAIGRAKAARAKRLEVEVMVSTNGPAIGARILALKNCAEDDWREQQDHRIGGLPGAPPVATAQIDLTKLTPEQAYAYVINGDALPPGALPARAGQVKHEAGDE
jgi:hypothetical protein